MGKSVVAGIVWPSLPYCRTLMSPRYAAFAAPPSTQEKPVKKRKQPIAKKPTQQEDNKPAPPGFPTAAAFQVPVPPKQAHLVHIKGLLDMSVIDESMALHILQRYDSSTWSAVPLGQFRVVFDFAIRAGM